MVGFGFWLMASWLFCFLWFASSVSLTGSSIENNPIGHFWVALGLSFKTSLSAKSLLWKSVFIHIEIRTNYHNKNFALRLALKERLRGTRKWPIVVWWKWLKGCSGSLHQTLTAQPPFWIWNEADKQWTTLIAQPPFWIWNEADKQWTTLIAQPPFWIWNDADKQWTALIAQPPFWIWNEADKQWTTLTAQPPFWIWNEADKQWTTLIVQPPFWIWNEADKQWTTLIAQPPFWIWNETDKQWTQNKS